MLRIRSIPPAQPRSQFMDIRLCWTCSSLQSSFSHSSGSHFLEHCEHCDHSFPHSRLQEPPSQSAMNHVFLCFFKKPKFLIVTFWRAWAEQALKRTLGSISCHTHQATRSLHNIPSPISMALMEIPPLPGPSTTGTRHEANAVPLGFLRRFALVYLWRP